MISLITSLLVLFTLPNNISMGRSYLYQSSQGSPSGQTLVVSDYYSGSQGVKNRTYSYYVKRWDITSNNSSTSSFTFLTNTDTLQSLINIESKCYYYHQTQGDSTYNFQTICTFSFQPLTTVFGVNAFDSYTSINNIYFVVTYSNPHQTLVSYWSGGATTSRTYTLTPTNNMASYGSLPDYITERVSITCYLDDTDVESIFDSGVYEGRSDNANFGFDNYLFAIADTPIIFLRSLFDYNLFGSNLYVILLSLVTLVVVLGIIRKFI